jgi:mRNA-degrading endonuclease toxin of MazEF toxin-antitoxin module
MKKGEIWLVEFLAVDGNKQSGTRPAIVLRRVEGTNICVVIPVTINLHALRFPYTLAVSPDRGNGLLKDSVALIFQLRVIDAGRIKRKLGFLKPSFMKRIDDLIVKLLLLGSDSRAWRSFSLALMPGSKERG